MNTARSQGLVARDTEATTRLLWADTTHLATIESLMKQICVGTHDHALGYAAIDSVPGSDALRWQLTKLVARSSRLIVEGQAREMLLLSSGTPSWEDYAACVEGKTSALFALPIEGAALIAGRSAEKAA